MERKQLHIDHMELPGMIEAFNAYHQGSALKRAVLTAMATQSSARHIGELRSEFLAWDTDGNGRISKEEMQAMMSGGHNGDLLGDNWEQIFDSIDTDGSGEIEYT